ncbi:MAG: DHH family phosphoesterase [Lachnospiraceae bacterium]|nr:DHH family phosphoesterase [Lachnospiraceae bacterium]
METTSKIKIKGRLKTYFMMTIYMGLLLLVLDGAILYFISFNAGLILGVFVLLYFGIMIYLYVYNRRVLTTELVSFATGYGQIQKNLLYELEIPHALLDDTGKIIWMNAAFQTMTHLDRNYRKAISTVFAPLSAEKLPQGAEDVQMDLEYEEGSYKCKMKRIPLQDLAKDSEMIDATDYEGSLVALYLFDETALKLALDEVDNESLAPGLIYLDNYDEALESIEEVRRSLLTALIDRKVNRYVASYDGIAKKTEKDKYFIVVPKRSCKAMQEARFDLLEDVKTVNIGNEMAVTISVGIGTDGLSYAQNYEFARNAIDLALGRGGDQAVVKTPEKTTYFGGKSQQVEKNTRVKARVKAHALREIIAAADDVIVMGHRLGDVDSFGAAVGIYRIAKTLDRKAHIVLNEITTSMEPLVDLFRNNAEYGEDFIINSSQAIDIANANTVLIIVDVNKPSITECPELLHICKSIVVFDHHRQGTEVIENATLSYVEPYASSTCEMVSEMLQYIGDNIKVHPEEADSMYSGIMVDTNNFMSKTGVRTFEAAAFLRRNGADVTRVRKLFREDAVEYKAKADAVSQAEIYRGCYAISVLNNEEGVKSPTVLNAQAANDLLAIKGIKASFMLVEYHGQIYVSARSIDEVNVQVIMERMGGGGHMSIAGCQMENVSVNEAIVEIKKTIDAMTEEGEL